MLYISCTAVQICLLGLRAPYSGAVGAQVQILEPGRCVAMLRERRRMRNHLNTVHMMALASLRKLASGLALVNSLPVRVRTILTGFSIDYLKKVESRRWVDFTHRV